MMRKTVFLPILLFCFCSFSFSQETEDRLYYFQQYENTESDLKEYLSNILSVNEINPDSLDIIYLNIIPPMGCPRCESLVIENNRHLQQQSDGKDFIVNVIVYPKPKALSAYIERQNFAGNVLFADSTQTLSSVFNTPHNTFSVPYITKVSLQSGRLISEYPALGISMSDEFVQNIRAKQDFLPLIARVDIERERNAPLSIVVNVDSWRDLRFNNFFHLPVDSFFVQDANKIPRVYNFSLDKNAHSLILSNFLSNAFALYSLDDNNVFVKKTELAPTAEEDKMFISEEISPRIYDYFVGMNMLVSMYLNASFAGDNIYIMASLPNLFIEHSLDSTMTIGYANEPVCLFKNQAGDLLSMILLDSIRMQVPEQYSLNHPVGVLFSENNTMAFPLKKGWPVRGTGAAPENYEESPFHDSFYADTKSVLFYNLTNKTAAVASPLDSLYAKYKLGYFFNSPMVKRINGHYYWTDSYIGKIYKLSQDFKTETLITDLFEMENVLEQMPFAENLPYIESYSKFFYRNIVDFNISPQGVFTALVKGGEHFYFYEINKNGKINISAFPNSFSNKEITNLQFGESTDNQQIVYALYQNNQQIVIYKFNF